MVDFETIYKLDLSAWVTKVSRYIFAFLELFFNWTFFSTKKNIKKLRFGEFKM